MLGELSGGVVFQAQASSWVNFEIREEGGLTPSVLLLVKGYATDRKLLGDGAALTSEYLRSQVLLELLILSVILRRFFLECNKLRNLVLLVFLLD